MLTGCPAPASNVEEQKGILETYAPELLNRKFIYEDYELTFSRDDTYVLKSDYEKKIWVGKIFDFLDHHLEDEETGIEGITFIVTYKQEDESDVQQKAICYSKKSKEIGFYHLNCHKMGPFFDL